MSMKKIGTSHPCCVLFFDTDERTRIKQILFPLNDVLNAILRDRVNCNYHTMDDNRFWITYEQSTGVEFDGYTGWGHIISFEEDWADGKTVLEVHIDAGSREADEQGWEFCKDDEKQIKNALEEVQWLLKHL